MLLELDVAIFRILIKYSMRCTISLLIIKDALSKSNSRFLGWEKSWDPQVFELSGNSYINKEKRLCKFFLFGKRNPNKETHLNLLVEF